MGEKFRLLRKEKGITAAFVSRSTGISQNRLCKIELGKVEMSGKELLKLCLFFDVDCREIA